MKLSSDQILSGMTINLPEILNLILSGEFNDVEIEPEEPETHEQESKSLRSVDFV